MQLIIRYPVLIVQKAQKLVQQIALLCRSKGFVRFRRVVIAHFKRLRRSVIEYCNRRNEKRIIRGRVVYAYNKSNDVVFV